MQTSHSKERSSKKRSAPRMLQVGILDTNPLTRSVYRYLLQEKLSIPCNVTIFSSPENCISQTNLPYDFLILDLDLLDDIEHFAQRLRRNSLQILLGAISDQWTQDMITDAIRAGFSGFFDRHLSSDDISHLLEQWMIHHTCIAPALLSDVLSLAKGALPTVSPSSCTHLTRREQEIRSYAISGLTNQQIADRLFLSKSTVDNHFINIYRKLGIKSRRQLVKMDASQEGTDFIPYFFPVLHSQNKEVLTMNQQLSEIYAFFSNIFMEAIPFPGESFTEELAGRVEQLIASDAELSTDAKNEFVIFLEDCKHDGYAVTQERLAVDRTMLFRGVRKENGPLPPYESFYMTCNNCGKEDNTLIQLADIYKRGGLRIPQNVHERPDYAGMELAFLSMLYRKEDPAAIALCKEFMDEHLRQWLPAFCDAMLRHAETSFFRGIAILLKCVILEQ